MARSFLLAAALCIALLGPAGCATPAPLPVADQARIAALLPADVLLLGEQHDAPAHQRLPPAALAEQQQRIRDGHCGALPEAQTAPMTRVQIARDIAMADTVAAARQPGRTVLLVAGHGHVQRTLGVPLHLPAKLTSKVLSARSASPQYATNVAATEADAADADLVWPTPPVPPRDYCAAFRSAPAH